MNVALTSIITAFQNYPIWIRLARQDIRSRYRGSLLGPLWLVLNLGLLVGALSIIYSTVFGLPTEVYVPYVATGLLAWWFISGVITDSCTAFTSNSQLIRNLKLPLGVYIMRVIARHLFLMAHNFLVYCSVAVAFGLTPELNTLFMIPGLVLLIGMLFSTGMILAIVCTRYRDVPHIVASVVQIAIFITPILFSKEMLQRRMIFAETNPFFHMVEAIRAPLLFNSPPMNTWIFLASANLILGSAALLLIRHNGHKIAYLV